MHKEIDFTQQGGYPFSQNTLAFLQDGIKGLSEAIVGLVGGGNVIISGCKNESMYDGSAVRLSAGWVVYNGELLPHIGGNGMAGWKLVEEKEALTFYDGQSKEVKVSKYLTTDLYDGDIDSSTFRRYDIARPEFTEPIVIDKEITDTNGDVLSRYFLEIHKKQGNYIHIVGHLIASPLELGGDYSIDLTNLPYTFDTNSKKCIGQSIRKQQADIQPIEATMKTNSNEQKIYVHSSSTLFSDSVCQVVINGYFKII